MIARRLCIVAIALCQFATVGLGQNSKENADFKLAINLYNDGLFDLAAEQLNQFISAFPNSAQGIEARFQLGLTQLKLKKFDDARMTFQTFALTYQDNPKAPEAWWNVGESYMAMGNYREAALAFERVKMFHPKSKAAPEALLRACQNFLLVGERENARRVLRSILQEYGSSNAVLSARTQLGRIYFEEGNLEQAQGELKRVIDGDPSNDAKAQALLLLGNIYLSMGRVDQAQSSYLEIITKYKSTSAVQGAFVNRGKLQASAGKYTEAAEDLKRALAEKNNVDSSMVREATISLGDVYTGLNNFNGAVLHYEKFLSAFPRDERCQEVLWKLAEVSAKGKNYKKSNDACNLLLTQETPDALRRRARLRLAMNAREQRNLRLAIQLLEAYVEQYPDDVAAPGVQFQSASIAENELHDPRAGSAMYTLLASRFPRSPLADDALAGAARCHEQLKEYDQALQIYKDLVQQYPASEFLQDATERILMIEKFEAKNKDSGLEKLALLVGDVVAEQDKAGLAYRLGEIYFLDLKNYAAAVTQFSHAIAGGVANAHFTDALFYRARAYEYLSWKDEQSRQLAIDSYKEFLGSPLPEGRKDLQTRQEEAGLSLFNLSATNLAHAHASYREILLRFPAFSRRDAMLLRIGQLQAAADSATAALTTLSQIPSGSLSAGEATYRRIELLLSLGLTDSANAESEGYITRYPAGSHTPVLLTRLGTASMEGGNPERAIECYQKLISDFSYTHAGDDARRLLADAYLSSTHPSEATALYRDLVQSQTADILRGGENDPSLMLALGRAEYQNGDLKEAKQTLFHLLAHHRTGELAGEAYSTLGMIFRSEGSLDIATSYFRQAGAVSPGTTAKPDVAALLFDSAEYNDAIKQYTRLLQIAKTDSEKQYYSARIIVAHLRSDDLKNADNGIAAFGKSFKDAPDDIAEFELERGSYFYRKEDYANALKAFKRVLSDYDETRAAPGAMYWTGKTLEATEKPVEAIEELNTLITRYPEAQIIPRAYFALGNIYYNGEKWGEAIKNYRRIVDDPHPDGSILPYAMSNLIETYETAGTNDAALSLTRKYLELYPHNDDSFDKRMKIGILYERLGYHDQAVLHLQSLLDEAGSDLEGEIRYYIAEANYNKGDYQQAILDFLKVPYLVTKKGKIDWTANSLYMSGQSYEKMGRHEQALVMYQQIIDRTGIDETFKTAARKEVDRVKLVLKKK